MLSRNPLTLALISTVCRASAWPRYSGIKGMVSGSTVTVDTGMAFLRGLRVHHLGRMAVLLPVEDSADHRASEDDEAPRRGGSRWPILRPGVPSDCSRAPCCECSPEIFGGCHAGVSALHGSEISNLPEVRLQGGVPHVLCLEWFVQYVSQGTPCISWRGIRPLSRRFVMFAGLFAVYWCPFPRDDW